MDNNIPNPRLQVRNKFKPKDNYLQNKERVKREMYKGTQGKREKIIAESKKNLKKLKELENSKNQINEIPTQIITKFISMEGIELKNEESLTNELTLPTEITILDLNKLLNEKLNNKEFQIYQFYINDIEIKNNIKETIKKIENF